MCSRRANPGTMLLGLLIWPNYFYQCYHGLQTPNEAFFHWNPKLLGVGRQNGQINSWTFGVFWPDCQHSLFLRLYIHILTKCLFGIGFWIWAAKKLRFSLRVSVVRGFKGLLLFYHSLISIGIFDKIKVFFIIHTSVVLRFSQCHLSA